MVDIVSIIVAVISLIGTLLVAGFSAYFTYSTEERKARRDAERLLRKYRDPLLFAAEDLQSRLWGIFEADVLSFHGRSAHHEDALVIYTCFVLGQFFAWTHVLRTQTQLLPFSLEEDKKLSKFTETLHSIQGTLLDNRYAKEEGTAFTLWRGHQMAIGEFMTEGDTGPEKLCMGFHEFTKAWKAGDANAQDPLRYWFNPVVEGLDTLIKKGPGAPDGNRLRRLQHLLHSKGISGCGAPPCCPCTACPGEVGVHDATGARKSPRSLWSRMNSETV
jgi:hypothetical protein